MSVPIFLFVYSFMCIFRVNRFPTIKKDLDISAKSSLFLFITVVVVFVVVAAVAVALVVRFILFFYSEMCC